MRGFVICLFITTCSGYNLPSYIKKCNVYDENLGHCIVDQIPKIRPYLKDGIKEINVPSLAPYYVPEILINAGLNRSFKMIDVEVFHLDDVQMQILELNPKNSFAKYRFYFKQLEIKGINEMDNQIFVLPISGHGPTKITIFELDMEFTLNYIPVERNGILYMDLQNKKSRYNAGNFTIKMDDLYDISYDRCKHLNVYLHNNWNRMRSLLMPAVTHMIITVIGRLLSDVLENVPAEVLYDFTKE